MQRSDREFIEKYKQKQFEMRHPAPEVVAPVIVNVVSKETTKKTFQEVVQESSAPVAVAQEVVQESSAPVTVTKEVVQEVVQVAATKEVIQKDINDTLQMVNELNVDGNPLELIKSALQQINYALRLLERETKKDQIVVEKSEPEVHIVVEQEAQNQPNIPASTELVSIDHISDVDVDEEKEEEFKIVMPNKSKTKKMATTTVLPVQEKAEKDDFPSIGSSESSFTPVKKNGFWSGESKKSLEIAKAIAHIPSPTPVSSPSPNLKKSIRMVRGGPAYDDSEDDYFDSTEEFHIRKRGGNDDE